MKCAQGQRVGQRGLSLIEMVVSIGLFAIIATIASGAILNSVEANARGRGVRMAMDNFGLAVESMSRKIRLGTGFHCDLTALPITAPRDCPHGGPSAASFVFYDQLGQQVAYYVQNGILYEDIDGAINALTEGGDITVTDFDVHVLGAEDAGDTLPPFVNLRIVGTTVNDRNPATVILQTSVSSWQRR